MERTNLVECEVPDNRKIARETTRTQNDRKLSTTQTGNNEDSELHVVSNGDPERQEDANSYG